LELSKDNSQQGPSNLEKKFKNIIPKFHDGTFRDFFFKKFQKMMVGIRLLIGFLFDEILFNSDFRVIQPLFVFIGKKVFKLKNNLTE